MADNWYAGNANDDVDQHRGWLLGHFINPAVGEARITSDVEVKWGVHPAGQRREEWTVGDERTTMLLMVSGRFRLETTVGKVVLQRQGDYVIWGPGIDHAWEAEEDSVVVTVRWPSIP